MGTVKEQSPPKPDALYRTLPLPQAHIYSHKASDHSLQGIHDPIWCNQDIVLIMNRDP